MLLEAHNLHIGYGDAPAVWDVSLDVGAGEIVAVIGPTERARRR
jgi:branched-chain amino acid transport system ATP-binding protein